MSTHLVFVYGSLKRGFHNYRLLERHGAEFLGAAVTADRHTLVKGTAFPFLINARDVAPNANIAGEVYEVDDECLAALDRLESHPRFYRREEITVLPEGLSGDSAIAWCYFLNMEGVRLDDISDNAAQPDTNGVASWSLDDVCATLRWPDEAEA